MPSPAKQKWLLLFNCQAAGMANCLTLISNEVEVEYFEPAAFAANVESVLSRISEYDKIVVAPSIEKNLDPRLGGLESAERLPTFSFAGYHPDHCNLIADGSWNGGPLAGNHSALVYCAFMSKLTVDQAVSLFREDTFAALGYFDQWDGARDALIRRYREYGFDIASAFVEWTRERGGFTYVPSHPKMACLKALAGMLLEKSGLGTLRTDVLPHDNMTNGVIFPVYPHVGPRHGVAGSFNFKPPGKYRFMDLPEFVGKSFAFYGNCKEIEVPLPWRQLIERVTSITAIAR